MKLKNFSFLWKASQCQGGDCPSISKVDGGYVLVGPVVGEETRAQIRVHSGIGGGEAAVFVPDDVIKRLWEGPS